MCICASLLNASGSFADTPAPAKQLQTHVEAVPTAVAHPDPTPTQMIKSGSEKVELQGEVQQNHEMSTLNSKLGFTSKPQGKEPFPAKITAVAPGSAVAKRGIASGDLLISEITNSDGSITMTMEHAGQGMRFTLKTAELTAAASKPVPFQLDSKNIKLSGGATDGGQRKQLKSIVDVLENHDLGLLIDCSGSMRTQDCPGGLSRWDWCCQEATGLAQAAAQASSSIDASIFNSQYQTYRHISPSQIPEIFAENRPGGGTEPAYALQEQLENYFNSSRAKPLTIVIVTDGLPNNPGNIAQVLRDESKKIRYQGELTITLLLIGERLDDQRMRQMIGLAPGSSVKNGGFVDVIPFEWTVGRGIKEAIFEDLREVRMATDPRHASKASETALGTPSWSNTAGQNSGGPYGGSYGGSYSGGSNGVVRQITSH